MGRSALLYVLHITTLGRATAGGFQGDLRADRAVKLPVRV